MARTQKLGDERFLHLLRLASGLLKHTRGDIVEAMRLAMPMHIELLRTIREDEIRSDLGPAEAVLFVPDEGGLAIRVERHASTPMTFPEIDITGFEVTESYSSHFSVPQFDGGVFEEDWD
ncbi:MAG: hypothetical protein H6736_21060 [Alphaproteobacteria bacterium]|nr:hypothetical protein [Alphaproteobacteria bacterium]MCB9694308.1 hypothetical protein [Alphaproteobacteria bacterium]